MTWVVYMLQSASTGRFYIGVTNTLDRRLKQHNGALKGGAKATRAGRPWQVVYHERCQSRGQAQSREAELKKLSRAEKWNLPGVRAAGVWVG